MPVHAGSSGLGEISGNVHPASELNRIKIVIKIVGRCIPIVAPPFHIEIVGRLLGNRSKTSRIEFSSSISRGREPRSNNQSFHRPSAGAGHLHREI